MQHRPRRARYVVEVRQILASDHHAAEDRHSFNRRTQLLEPLAKAPSVEEAGPKRTSPSDATREVCMIVGHSRQEIEPHVRVGSEEIQHFWSVRQMFEPSLAINAAYHRTPKGSRSLLANVLLCTAITVSRTRAFST